MKYIPIITAILFFLSGFFFGVWAVVLATENSRTIFIQDIQPTTVKAIEP